MTLQRLYAIPAPAQLKGAEILIGRLVSWMMLKEKSAVPCGNSRTKRKPQPDHSDEKMSIIKIPDDERDTLKAIDIDRLRHVIEEYPCDEQLKNLRAFRLEHCGIYVANQFQTYKKALTAYSTAKSSRKIAETKETLCRASDRLISAVQLMKERLEIEEKEEQRFHVDDDIQVPFSFTTHLTVLIHYRWRKSTTSSWESGCITFIYNVLQEPGKRDRQEMLSREWEHLRDSGLQSVRDFFRQGGNGSAIPKTFQAVVNLYTQGLDNFSTDFWRPERQNSSLKKDT
ncbi:hypothetical protein QQF31_01220 [Lelliottia sp. V106_5]|nr:hypothetical protein [Lelliottia sp. V106_5]